MLATMVVSPEDCANSEIPHSEVKIFTAWV